MNVALPKFGAVIEWYKHYVPHLLTLVPPAGIIDQFKRSFHIEGDFLGLMCTQGSTGYFNEPDLESSEFTANLMFLLFDARSQSVLMNADSKVPIDCLEQIYQPWHPTFNSISDIHHYLLESRLANLPPWTSYFGSLAYMDDLRVYSDLTVETYPDDQWCWPYAEDEITDVTSYLDSVSNYTLSNYQQWGPHIPQGVISASGDSFDDMKARHNAIMTAITRTIAHPSLWEYIEDARPSSWYHCWGFKYFTTSQVPNRWKLAALILKESVIYCRLLSMERKRRAGASLWRQIGVTFRNGDQAPWQRVMMPYESSHGNSLISAWVARLVPAALATDATWNRAVTMPLQWIFAPLLGDGYLYNQIWVTAERDPLDDEIDHTGSIWYYASYGWILPSAMDWVRSQPWLRRHPAARYDAAPLLAEADPYITGDQITGLHSELGQRTSPHMSWWMGDGRPSTYSGYPFVPGAGREEQPDYRQVTLAQRSTDPEEPEIMALYADTPWGIRAGRQTMIAIPGSYAEGQWYKYVQTPDNVFGAWNPSYDGWTSPFIGAVEAKFDGIME